MARATDSGDDRVGRPPARLLPAAAARTRPPRRLCHRTLASAADPELRAAALRALGEVAAPEDVVVAHEYATNPDAYVRLGTLSSPAQGGHARRRPHAAGHDLRPQRLGPPPGRQVLVAIGDTTTPVGEPAGMAATPTRPARNTIAEAAAATASPAAPRRRRAAAPHDTPESR